MQLMPMIQQKFWTKDGNNLPLSFGSLTFYYHGTTDFAPTYQNNGGAENDNPLALDINGECQVWLDPAISYDIILKDADGADVDTREAVQVGDGGGGGGDTYTVKVTALDSTPNTLNYKVTNENAGIRVSTIGSAGTNQALQIGVKLSTDPTNAASLDATGLFVSQGRQGPPGPAGAVGSVVDTDSVDLTLTGDVLQADVRISGVAGNGLSLNPDGLFATANPSVDDTATVNLTLTGGHLSADVNISGTAGNQLTSDAGGLLVPAVDLSGYIKKDTSSIPYPGNIQSINTILSVGNTNTLNLSNGVNLLKRFNEIGVTTVVDGFQDLSVYNQATLKGRYLDFALWTSGDIGFYEYHQQIQTKNNIGVVITNGLIQKASNYGSEYVLYDYLHGESDRYSRLSDIPSSIAAITDDPTGFDNPDNVTRSYDTVNRTVTLSGTAKMYYKGKVVLDLALGSHTSVAHTATDATWFYYYENGSYIWSTTQWTFKVAQIFAGVYQTAYKFGISETHALMPWQAHEEFHQTIGTYRKSGGGLSGYVLGSTTFADRRPAVASAIVKDEDLETTLALLPAGSYTRLHLIGAGATPTFTLASSDITPVSGTNAQWNEYTGGAWQLTTISTNNRWYNVWLLAIPVTSDATSQAYRYVWVTGQTLYTSSTSANAETSASINLAAFGGLLTEFVFICRITIAGGVSSWNIQAVTDITGSKVIQDQISGTGLSTVSTTDSATVTWTGNGTASSPLVATAVGFVKDTGHTDLGVLPWSVGDSTSYAASSTGLELNVTSTYYKKQGKGGYSEDGRIYCGSEIVGVGALWSKASTSGLVYAYAANVGAIIATGSTYGRMILEHTGAPTGRRVWDLFTINGSVYARWLSDDGSTNNQDCFGIDSNGKLSLTDSLKIGSIPTGTQTYLLGQDSSGNVIRGATPVSATAGNAITLNADGVYAPTPAVATTTTSLIQTVEKANTTTITMPSAWTMYGYCDRMPYGGTFNSIDVISPNGLGGSGTGIRGFIGKVTSRTAGNYTATILARTANYATNSTGLVNIALSNSATLLQGEEWCLILRVDKSASGDLLALVPSAGLSSSNYLSLGENTAGADPAVGGTITFYAGTPAMLPWVRALA